LIKDIVQAKGEHLIEIYLDGQNNLVIKEKLAVERDSRKHMTTSRSLVIDFHIHLGGREHWLPWVNEFWERFFESSGIDPDEIMEPQRLQNLLKEEGVDYAVALAEVNPLSTGVVTNEYVAEFCKGVESLIPFANINPYTTPEPAKKLEIYVKEYGFKGLKLLPSYQWFYPNDNKIYPIYAKAEELQIPVMIHTGSSIFKGHRMKYSDPIYLDDVAVDFPDLTLIQAHSGRGFWYDRAFFLAQLHENVYLEIAGLPPQNLLTYFPQLERLAHKVLFGSDWPGCPGIRKNIEAVKNLPLSSEAKAKILGENAARILSLL
jgi:hypothetical protein